MTNIERLTARLNSLKHRRAVYNALIALAPIIRAAREDGREKELLEDLKEDVKKGESK